MLATVRMMYPESFAQAPGLNADVADPNVNKNWEAAGANVAAGVLGANGVLATTAGADGDQHIVTPHQDADQSMIAVLEYRSNLHPDWDNIVSLATEAELPQFLVSGFKTTLDFDPTSDADALIFFFDLDDVATQPNWRFIERIGGVVLATVDTGIPVAANTMQRLRIRFNDQQKAEILVGQGLGDLSLIHTTSVIPNTITTWKPYFGVEQADDAVEFGYHKADIQIDPALLPSAEPAPEV